MGGFGFAAKGSKSIGDECSLCAVYESSPTGSIGVPHKHSHEQWRLSGESIALSEALDDKGVSGLTVAAVVTAPTGVCSRTPSSHSMGHATSTANKSSQKSATLFKSGLPCKLMRPKLIEFFMPFTSDACQVPRFERCRGSPDNFGQRVRSYAFTRELYVKAEAFPRDRSTIRDLRTGPVNDGKIFCPR